MGQNQTNLLQGTLDLLILKAIGEGELHAVRHGAAQVAAQHADLVHVGAVEGRVYGRKIVDVHHFLRVLSSIAIPRS